MYGKGICHKCYLAILKIKNKYDFDEINKNQTGKNNPNYKHGLGYSGYPLKFSLELRNFIRKRDGYACQKCDIKQEDYYRRLDVHHIDYNKFNCKKSNLITLCSSCNNLANGQIDYWYAYYTYIMENYIL